ncbi:ArsR family transcriptional regulator [Streptomyces sp. NPDC021020]|uniref:ArsR family transcriptional regulator n=1 Tax=Streptomyces sp. NPDC021020 TaxID=3365109 RepID=UPI0037A23B43
MKTSPSLLPLLRSRAQGEVLALLLLHPEREYSLSELAEEMGVTPTTVLREVERLTVAGILADRRVGRSRLVRARTDTVLYQPLSDLIAASFGPLPVLTDALAALGGVRRAFIYGSWAARYTGQPGPPPADVDVLVIGEPDADELFDLAEEASRRLHRAVNVHRLSDEAWQSPSDDPFLTSVRERPLVELKLARETA